MEISVQTAADTWFRAAHRQIRQMSVGAKSRAQQIFCLWHIMRFAQSWHWMASGFPEQTPECFLLFTADEASLRHAAFDFYLSAYIPAPVMHPPGKFRETILWWEKQDSNWIFANERAHGLLLPTASPKSHPTAMPWVSWLLAFFFKMLFMVKCISMLNNSALKVCDKTEEDNRAGLAEHLHSLHLLPHQPSPHSPVTSRGAHGEQTKLQPVGADKDIKGIKMFGGRTLPHKTQARTRAGDRCFPFSRQTRVSGGRRCQSSLHSLAGKSLLCVIPIWMLYPQPHPKYMVLDRHWLGQGASHIQSLAQWAPLLWGSEEQP